MVQKMFPSFLLYVIYVTWQGTVILDLVTVILDLVTALPRGCLKIIDNAQRPTHYSDFTFASTQIAQRHNVGNIAMILPKRCAKII